MSRDAPEFRPLDADVRRLPAGATSPSCFSDEVAIDFPSVDQFVPRVRDRFFGLHPDAGTLAVQILVSPREASRGTTVPFEVALRGTCDVCGGRGETWSDACVACDGSGHTLVRRPVRISVPAGVTDGTRLHLRVSLPLAISVHMEVSVAIGQSLA